MSEEVTVFIDFEFSMPEGRGHKGFFPEIIEVGLLAVHRGKQEQFSSYVRPRVFKRLTRRCKNFLNISQQQVDKGIPLHMLVEKLKQYNDAGHCKVVTWGNMDMKVLKHNCQVAKLPFPFSGEFVDLSMEYKRFFGDRNQTGLWKAVQEYGKDGTGRHHKALDDAMTTYHIYQLVEKDKKYLNRSESTTIGDRVDFSALREFLAQ
ncbi:sporulation protein [Jeotgalibacillus alimentarius]|uniref:Sporulation protein n=2 Tax=Jeotgalibacillus TaxID=157226 RepID=A0A0C2VD65_9BACL|nr:MULTISPECIES: 3'-5' exonuclease KapD [Jeotgalibacillus]KIL46887.1 sporulation protein [Jeotgalibacillus alimentarius]MBM7580519.1 sporulation inhibitor KapD [Jeotgalibacillus terrae]